MTVGLGSSVPLLPSLPTRAVLQQQVVFAKGAAMVTESW